MRRLVVRDVSVVPMRNAAIYKNVDVVIDGGAISQISPSSRSVYDSAVVIDGSEKYLLPGLHDMHVHATMQPNFLPLYLLHGVTTVRDMAAAESILAWKKETLPSCLMSPEVYACGPLLEGERQMWNRRFSRPVVGGAAVKGAVESLISSGADFIKVYHSLEPDDYLTASRTARSLGKKVAGHDHRGLSLDEVAANLDSIEHSLLLLRRFDDEGQSDLKEYAKRLSMALKFNETAFCPTLVVSERYSGLAEEFDRLVERYHNALRYTTNRDIDHWSERAKMVRIRTDLKREAELVKHLSDMGVKLILGTDVHNPFVFPGLSLHEELKLLTESAGLGNYMALEAGTVNAAEFLDSNAGTIEVGKAADLILVEGNPIENISVLREPTDVIVRGRHFTREEISASLQPVAA